VTTAFSDTQAATGARVEPDRHGSLSGGTSSMTPNTLPAPGDTIQGEALTLSEQPYVHPAPDLQIVPTVEETVTTDFQLESERDAQTGWLRRYGRIMAVADFACASAATALSYVLRTNNGNEHKFDRQHWWLGLFMPVATVAVLGASRAYEQRFLGSSTEEFKRVGNAMVRLIAAVAVIAFATHTSIARGWLLEELVIATGLLLCARAVGRASLIHARKRGACTHRVIVVGSAPAARRLVDEMHRGGSAYQVVGACTTTPRDSMPLLEAQIPVMGDVKQALTAALRMGADTIAVTAGEGVEPRTLRQLAWQLEGTGIHLLVSPALTEIAGSRIHIRPVSGLPLLHVEEPELSGGRQLAKSTMDRSTAILALVLLSPMLLTVGLVVRLTSTGPAFFRQERVGRHGKTFRMVKFRSMFVDAEARRAELEKENENDGIIFKIRNDPRITPVGRVIRRLSIDELPQLINVARGQMSLVGPRPPLPGEVARYGDEVRRRLLVRPGLTGLWQVSGRSDLAWDEAVRLDLHYVENWSLMLDLTIIAKTVRAVLSADGAY
jgi:exopolysaccharide biosynthesis polyprenyl glycosylphosphotransferase